MKRIYALIFLALTFIPFLYGREYKGDNELNSLKEYFNANKYDLNLIEGLYKITIRFYYNNQLIHEIKPFDIIIDEFDKDNDTFILAYVGYEDPIEHSSIPEAMVLENPGSFIMFGFIYNYPSNSNQYVFRWTGGYPGEDGIHNSFVLDVGADDFNVEFNLNDNKIDYWGYPSKYKNKMLRMTLEAKKIFPLH